MSISPNKSPQEIETSFSLTHHPTDFSVKGKVSTVEGFIAGDAKVQHLAIGLSRVTSSSAEQRDQLMEKVRQNLVAHHIYRTKDTSDEVVIADCIYLTMADTNPDKLNKIIQDFKLREKKQIGRTHILELTNETGINPLKVANKIVNLDSVESCLPKTLKRAPLHTPEISPIPDLSVLKASHKLLDQQWYLANDGTVTADVKPTAHINAHEAWKLVRSFGSPDIVIAVIDDGFDLAQPGIEPHAVFKNKLIKGPHDFAEGDSDPQAKSGDFHGTRIASLATASRDGDGMLGVAPGCALQPLGIGSGPNLDFEIIMDALEMANQSADVVNCSFNTQPSTDNDFPPGFAERIKQMTLTGGRRGKGLVIVVSAGNDDAPIHLSAKDNVNGVRFVQETTAGKTIEEIEAGKEVFSGFPKVPEIIVVGAISSLKRKAGYSNWGSEITVVAPSDNGHEILEKLEEATPEEFVADYRGLGMIAALNRLTESSSPQVLRGTAIPDFDDEFYTGSFGGTSGASALVTGVAALMLSVNDNLSATDVIEILQSTADKDLDTTLDLAGDPNLKGFSGEFVNGHSIFFGAGKVDAAAAVKEAIRRLPNPAQ